MTFDYEKEAFMEIHDNPLSTKNPIYWKWYNKERNNVICEINNYVTKFNCNKPLYKKHVKISKL